ncbi:MAG: prephenate dehydrogenase/arogenate dehydrogenase family protein [Acidobacteria bacterium]|nr:prephenate dehydrogenase/arogenate dehydrogenase family protein [Acidobacteriota bacterium]
MKITIIGCGLIGGSIALALKRRRPEYPVACLDLPERIPAIREARIADQVGTFEELSSHIPESEIVILATPVQSILPTIALIAPLLRENTIVTDVGSTKELIMAEAQKRLPSGVHFIGGHPMAGSEHSGVEAADPLLFSDRVYVLCPYPDTPPDAMLSLLDLVESLPATPITIDPEEHDRIMAMVSHLPQLASVALMHAAQAGDAEHGMLEKLAGRGFLDMTRLAASEYGLWKGILETNREALRHAVEQFGKSLAFLSEGISGNEIGIAWEQAGRRRRKMVPDSLARPRKHDLRSMIDRFDKQLLTALGHRIAAARKIGKLKASQAAPVVDADRERRLMQQRKDWGKSLNLPDELVEDLFAVILKHSSRIQADKLQGA